MGWPPSRGKGGLAMLQIPFPSLVAGSEMIIIPGKQNISPKNEKEKSPSKRGVVTTFMTTPPPLVGSLVTEVSDLVIVDGVEGQW